MSIVEVNDLKKYYGREPNITRALDGITLSIAKGSFTAIVGVSGSGKSTLLNMIGGLDIPTSGAVSIQGMALEKMNDEQLTVFRRRNIGFVFQSYNLVPTLNVLENILLPIDLDGSKADHDYIDQLLDAFMMKERMYSMSNQLSGGEQQRVAIIRALASKPALLLADEPTGNLDSKNSEIVMETLKKANVQFQQTILMITHNELLAQMADATIHIEDGRLLRGGVI